MKFESGAALAVVLGVVSARPNSDSGLYGRVHGMVRREVPQEHSHEPIVQATNTALNLNNPAGIKDAVFGLLGNAAASAGAGTITNTDCLQQATADQAFTNAKAAGDVNGQANALLYRALERNTGSVGLASVICNETAVNPEVAAITQHQDPASTNAAATNKQIALTLAKQLASIGADPQLAIQSGTFAPGKVGDTTGKGNSCDDIVSVGCIVQQNLLVPDVTAAEITAAVGSGSTGAAASNSTATSSSSSSTESSAAAATSAASAAGSAANTTAGATSAAGGTNVNTFTGSLGSAPVPVISSAATAGRPFSVNGDTFVNEGAAIQRACAVQNNACSNAANSGSGAVTGGVTACNAQETQCNAQTAAKKRATSGTNVNTFTGTLGAAAVPVISSTATAGRPFSVNGDTFVNEGAAIQRACSVQNTQCSNAANSGSGAVAGGVAACNAQEAQCNAQTAAKKRGAFKKRAALSFGSCGSPAIQFAAGLDGRKENSFQAVDQTDFNHGSALGIAVITSFNCQQLQNKCKADAATVTACNQGAQAASALTGQAAADAFNSALGVSA